MDEKKDNREESNSKVVATPEIALGDSEILGTPKNQQKDKKRRKKQKKVDQDTLLKSKKLQKHKLRRKKQKKVVTTTEPSEIDSDDPKKLKKPSLFSLHLDLSMGKKMKRRHESGVEITPEISLGDSEILVTPKNQQKAKKRKKQNKIESKKNLKKVEIIQEPESNKNLKKIIDGLSDRLNEMTEIVQKLKETSDLLEKEKETPKKKVVECCFESEDAFRNHQKTVFVEGFRCSPPRGDIKSALIKHFSPCGEVSTVFIPFHCQTGVPMGFAFINMIKDYDKALTLDGSYLDGLRLTVKMAIKREEYYVFTNHNGCERCGIALSTHIKKQRFEQFYSRNRLSSQMTCVPVTRCP